MAGGVEAVAGLGLFEEALHDVYEEADYEPAVIGFLADYVGEGWGGGFRVFCVREHWFDNKDMHSGVSRGG